MQRAQLAVLGAEVVPPLRDAVRLVYREQRDLSLFEHRQRSLLQQALGRNVEQLERAGMEALFDIALLLPIKGGIEERGVDADFEQRVDLVVHLRKDPVSGKRRVVEVVRVDGLDARGRYQLRPLYDAGAARTRAIDAVWEAIRLPEAAQ